jgi:hypothetical protein
MKSITCGGSWHTWRIFASDFFHRHFEQLCGQRWFGPAKRVGRLDRVAERSIAAAIGAADRIFHCVVLGEKVPAVFLGFALQPIGVFQFLF